jgi:hypothetical protein
MPRSQKARAKVLPDPLRYLIPLSPRGADRVLRALSPVRLDPRTSQSLRRLADLVRMPDRGSPREAHSHPRPHVC